MFPGISGPRIVAGFTGAWYCVKLPQFLAGRYVVGGNKSANARFSTRRSNKHFVIDCERRCGDRITQLWIGDRNIPDNAPIGCVERHQTAVERPHEQNVAGNRKSAVYQTAARM